MSWQDWVNNMMLSKSMLKGVIAGQEGAVWASTTENGGANLTTEEIKKIARICKGDCPEMSIHVEGKKYLVTRVDKDAAICHFKQLHDDDVEKRKISGTAALGKQTVIIGLDKDENSKANLSKTVTDCASRLSDSGF